jgi:hypothetical protein
MIGRQFRYPIPKKRPDLNRAFFCAVMPLRDQAP